MVPSPYVLALTTLLSVHESAAFRRPAPFSAINPLPHSFPDVRRSFQSSGWFDPRNNSVQPWNVEPDKSVDSAPFTHLTTVTNSANSSSYCTVQPGQQSEFWLPNIAHQGTSPFLANNTDYAVYRNVKDYGAKGDGVTDDSAAFNATVYAGGRCPGGQCGGTTGKPALIYVPPGTYVFGSTVHLLINTQIIGDALNWPTFKFSSSVQNGTILLDGYDPGQPSLNNFFIGVRNVNLDTTAAAPNITVFALNWAVSQATNLINVNFNMPNQSNHIGIEMDGGEAGGGSGMFIGDLTFNGGLIGILYNNQQHAMRNLKFNNIGTAIAFRHGFVVTLQQINCANVGICIDLGPSGTIGSMTLLDSWCESCGTVVSGSASVVLENVCSTNSGPMLTVDGNVKLNGTLEKQTYAAGYVHYSNDGSVVTSNGTMLPYTKRGNLTDANGLYVTKQQPQYTDYSASAFASVKDAGAKGDGQTDDTAAINAALLANANCKITYFPHGVYVVTDTIYVPPGSRLVGEIWSILTASGSNFADSNAPRPMLQVGLPDETGSAEFSDLLFTVAAVLPGAILVEVNMAGTTPAAVSFHNTHTRVGGAADSATETTCSNPASPCRAAYLHAHLAPTSSTYLENSWLWTADHDLDGTASITMGVGRGLLLSSQRGTWLIGTASEHQVLYAYQFLSAQNVFAALMQVESPYWQPSPPAPFPWTPNTTALWQDPTFTCPPNSTASCYMQWHLRILGRESSSLALYGQAFWVFFNSLSGDCSAGPDSTCQTNAVDLQGLDYGGGRGVEIYNLNTRAVYDLIRLEGAGGRVAAGQPGNYGSWGGVVAAYLGFA